MKLSELIREYVDLKVKGEPNIPEWTRYDAGACAVSNYRYQLEQLESAIDACVEATKETK